MALSIRPAERVSYDVVPFCFNFVYLVSGVGIRQDRLDCLCPNGQGYFYVNGKYWLLVDIACP